MGRCETCAAEKERVRMRQRWREMPQEDRRERYQHVNEMRRLRPLVEERDGYVCVLCGRPALDDDPLTLDHIVPRAHDGPTTLENLRLVHRSENSSMGSQVRRPS